MRQLCAGGAADGVLEVVATSGDEAEIVIWNPDGSTAELSGNGTRIAARWLSERTGATDVRIRVGSRVVGARMVGGDDVEQDLGEVDVYEPERVAGLEVTPVSVGNPHAVVEGDPDDLPLIGPLLETHPRFPNRTNVQVARLEREGEITARVWERGAGETSASGTSAVAVAAALRQNPAAVRFPGGTLCVRFEGRRALLTGPAKPFPRFAVSSLEREIMLLLVDDDSTPLTVIEGTLRARPSPSLDVPVTRSAIKDALRSLMERGFAKLVYYDPHVHEPRDTRISTAEGLKLLEDPESWTSPLEKPEDLQVRAIDTALGRSIFF